MQLDCVSLIQLSTATRRIAQLNFSCYNQGMLKSNKAEINSATLSIKTLLTWRGILQKDAAKALGITPPSFSKRLNGDTRFTADEVVALSKMLNVSTDVLLGRKPLEVK